MATTPPPGDCDQPAQRWTGRARVSAPPPSATRQPQPHVAPRQPVSPPALYQGPAYGGKKKLKPRLGRIAIITAVVLALIAGVAGVTSYMWIKNVDDGLKRTDPFADIAGRPQKLAAGTINILLLGTDSRDPDARIDQAGEWRTDTIVIMHIPASQDKAYLISIPRDLWVTIPGSSDGEREETKGKINAAYAFGGAPLMVQTVELFTGVRMDHVALIDFGGFVKVTDAVGGVDMTVEKTITSIHPPNRTFQAGMNHFNGEEALDYVRQRYQFTDGDFARIRNQQAFLKALLDKAVSAGTVTNIGAFRSFVSSVADAMTVDNDFSLIDLGWQFRNLRGDNLVFMTSPVSGTDKIGGQSVVVSDREKASGLFDAVANDTVTAWQGEGGPAAATPGG